MINAWLLCAALWLPSAAAVPATAKASNDEELRQVVQTGTPHITITASFATRGGLVLNRKEIQSLRGTCHLDSPGASRCKLDLGDTIQIFNDLWLDGLDLVPPTSGNPALQLPKINTQLWMTNVSMNGNGSPNASGIDLNGRLFAESCTFSQLKAQAPGRAAAVRLGGNAATAALHHCKLAGNNVLDADPAVATVHVDPGSKLMVSSSAFSECVRFKANMAEPEARGARNEQTPCVATTAPTVSTVPGAISVPPAEVYYYNETLQYAVYGEDSEIQSWEEAARWTPEAGEREIFLSGDDSQYEAVREAAASASALEQQEQQASAEGDRATTAVSTLPPGDRSPGRSSPSGTLIAALVGSVVVLVILAAATVVALLLLQRHRRRGGAGGLRGGGTDEDRLTPTPHGTGDGDTSGFTIQAPYGVPPPASRGHGGHTMSDKTATFTPGGLHMQPPGHAYAAVAPPPALFHHNGRAGPMPFGIGAHTGSMNTPSHASAQHAAATAPVSSAVPRAAPPFALPPPGVSGGGAGAGGGASIAVLTAANLSLLEQSIPAALQANPFSHPPAIRSKLSVEQGLQDALDSLIISGRPLMGRYTLDASTMREVTPKSIVQFASEVPEAARPVAVKFFVSRPHFEREEAALGNEALQGGFDRDALSIESNYDGSLRAPNGYIYPPCIVMPRGEGLRAWAAMRDPKLLEVAQMLMHVGRRLAAVHRNGWAHRNLHPGNVLQRLGDPGNWLITDWNCAAKIGTFPPLVDGLRYCPPEDVTAVEQGQVATKATAAADVWALGIIAYETLTASTLFPPGTTEKQIRDRVTGRLSLPWEESDAVGRERVRTLRGFRRSVLMCLERNPMRRPRSTEVVNMWQALFDGPTTTTDNEPSDRLPPAAESAPTAGNTADTPLDTTNGGPTPTDVHISAMPSL